MFDLPFFIRHPDGLGKGKHINSLVYNFDIFPTILESLNITSPKPVDGQSLWKLIDNDNLENRKWVTCGFNSYVWIRDENYAYITDYDRKNEYLYNLIKDPMQNENIAESNPDVNQKMFEMILKDADGELIDHSTALMKKIEEWYTMSI